MKDVHRGIVGLFFPEEVASLMASRVIPSFERYEAEWSRRSFRQHEGQAMLVDFATYLPEGVLAKVDRAAMAVALETRAPFLDHRLLEFAFRLPQRYLRDKNILRAWLYRRVPKYLVDRPKRGFSVPLAQWLRGPLRDLLLDVVTDERLRELGINNKKMIVRYVEEHMSGHTNHSRRLWALLMLALWYERVHLSTTGSYGRPPKVNSRVS
jgi:asparagine synthase (glutamine-hydrolysing)